MNKNMMIWIISMIIIVTGITLTGCGVLDDSNNISKEDALEDFDSLVKQLKAKNPMLFTDVEQFNKTIEEQRSMVQESSTLTELYQIMAPVVSAVNCGHTRLFYPDGERVLDGEKVNIPMRLSYYDKVLVIEAVADSLKGSMDDSVLEGLIDAEVISINGLSSEEIMDRIYNSISADNGSIAFKNHVVNLWFNSLYQRYIELSDTYEIVYKQNGDGQNLDTQNNKAQNSKKLIVDAISKDELTFGSEDNLEVDMKNSSLVFEDYGYLRVNTFDYYSEGERNEFYQFIDEFFLEMSSDHVEHIVLDLRSNYGGDPYCGEYLLSYLLLEERPYFSETMSEYDTLKELIAIQEHSFEGQLYILINGGCFSTTGHVLGVLKDSGRGVFIGEEAGGTYQCSDWSKEYELPNTDIILRTSTKVFQVYTEHLTSGQMISPDYYVEDRMGEADMILNKALELMGVD